MNDELAAAPAIPTRRSVRWYHVAILCLAVVTAGGAFALMTTRQSERDDAASSLARARHDVVVDQRSVAAADRALKDAKAKMAAYVGSLNDALATERTMANIGAQNLDASRDIQRFAANGDVTSLNGSALPRSKDLTQQWTNLWDTLTTQLQVPPPPTTRGRS
jgi:hypothetical protein